MPESDLQESVGLRTHPLTAVTTGLVFALPGAAAVGLPMIQDGELPDLPVWLLLSLPLLVLLGGFLVGTVVGYVSWYFTTYVIDGDEVRVSSGVLRKQSRRVPYERLQSVDIAQPLLARVVGLSELRLETAGGSDSRTPLKYLRLDDARALRRVLLDRAHGTDATAQEGPAERSTDAARRTVLLHVEPGRLVLATLVSLDFATALAGGLLVLAVLLLTDVPAAAIGGVVPFATVLVRIVANRVAAQWDSTLSEGGRGLRIERGLLSRTSQTIPWERVQGLAVEQPVVWRRLRWARLRIDVAGYGDDAGDESGEVTSTLVPVADRDVVMRLVDHVLAARPDVVGRTGPPRRAWPFAPFVWRQRWVGADDETFIGVEGWFQRRTNVVPHRKTQSVELRQGPLQRRFGVATIEVHTPAGPVDADGRHLDAETARDLALRQVELARLARSATSRDVSSRASSPAD